MCALFLSLLDWYCLLYTADDKELSDEERSEYIATLQTSLEKLTFLTNSLIKIDVYKRQVLIPVLSGALAL